jgi:UPF0755 protein
MNLFSRRKLLFAVPVLLLLLIGFSFSWFLFIPPSKTALSKVVYIKRGMSLRKVSELLEKEGVIRNRLLFIGFASCLGKKSKIKAGEYEFNTRMLPMQVLDNLGKGQVKRHLVTIVEGTTLAQIGQLLGDLNIVGKDTFLQKTASKGFISSLGLPPSAVPSLEGYLFPDTYYLIREMEPEEVIQIMVNQFKKTVGAELAVRTAHSTLSEREILILASIIEKETPLPEEKPLISAVFYNRLRIGMPLQSDPTVIYGIKNFDGNLKKEHLLRPTPYNTYVNPGLPPTPICNPGKDSILAALSPAAVPFLYFVSKNDGSHFFSSEIEDHNRAVWRYQKNRHTENHLTKK